MRSNFQNFWDFLGSDFHIFALNCTPMLKTRSLVKESTNVVKNLSTLFMDGRLKRMVRTFLSTTRAQVRFSVQFNPVHFKQKSRFHAMNGHGYWVENVNIIYPIPKIDDFLFDIYICNFTYTLCFGFEFSHQNKERKNNLIT